MKYDINLVKKVVEEYKENPNKLALSKKFEIPRATLRYWLNSDYLQKKNLDIIEEQNYLKEINNKIVSNKSIYSFILGLYMGDGCITKNRMSYRLRIVQDKKYPNSVEEIRQSVDMFFGKKSTMTFQEGCAIVTIFDKYLPWYFPQHGAGKKHDRKIELSKFQVENLDYRNLMRGLFISDGSYYLAQKKYECYNFTNKSLDIINIFRDCLNHFDISHKFRTKPNGIHIVEILKKFDVSKIKELVGVKS